MVLDKFHNDAHMLVGPPTHCHCIHVMLYFRALFAGMWMVAIIALLLARMNRTSECCRCKKDTSWCEK